MIGGQDANGRSVDSSATDATYGYNGGAISITASNGDIAVAGGLRARRGSASYTHGNLTLSAPNGSITVGSLDAAVVNQIYLQAGHAITVTGVLTNFTVSESPKKFTFPTSGSAVSGDIVYYSRWNSAIPLAGTYDIYIAGAPTGFKLKDASVAGTLLIVQ
jgi:hypothetical protein